MEHSYTFIIHYTFITHYIHYSQVRQTLLMWNLSLLPLEYRWAVETEDDPDDPTCGLADLKIKPERGSLMPGEEVRGARRKGGGEGGLFAQREGEGWWMLRGMHAAREKDPDPHTACFLVRPFLPSSPSLARVRAILPLPVARWRSACATRRARSGPRSCTACAS